MVDGSEWGGAVRTVMPVRRWSSVVLVLGAVVVSVFVLLGVAVFVVVVVAVAVVVVVTVIVVVAVAVIVVVVVVVQVDAGMPLFAVCDCILEEEEGNKFSVSVMVWVIVQWCF